MTQERIFEIPQEMVPHIGAAVVRLGYLHPHLEFRQVTSGIEIKGGGTEGDALQQRDVLHAVYREKIFSETLDMRRMLIGTVTRR